MAVKKKIERVKADHEMQLMAINGVEGVGVGEEAGKPVIKVYVSGKTPALKQAIPAQLDGYPVRTEVSGEFHAQ